MILQVILLDASFFVSNTHFDPVMLTTWAHGTFEAPGTHSLQCHELLVDSLLPQQPVGTAYSLRDRVRFQGLGISGLNDEGNFGSLPRF
jgi:hypothetical protein